jgi:hypothetical protein
MSELPPDARLREPLDPTRPTVVGQPTITQQLMPDGRIKVSSDRLDGFILSGTADDIEYVAVYSRREAITTAEHAAAWASELAKSTHTP